MAGKHVPGATIGRPRDTDMERRAMEAALEIYGRLGWSGFTFGKVAAQAHVGKSSLYRRWSSKDQLLLDAFNSTDAFFARRLELLEDLPFAQQMRYMVRDRLVTYFSPMGLAVIRLSVENQAVPDEVGPLWEQSMGRAVLHTRGMIRDAIASGELVPETSVVGLGDALEGAMIMHALATPAALRERTEEGLQDYAMDLIDRIVTPWLTPAGREQCDYCNSRVPAREVATAGASSSQWG